MEPKPTVTATLAMLTKEINGVPMMSSKQLAELLGKRHDSVKRAMERLGGSGVIAFTPMVDMQIKGNNRHYTEEAYYVNERNSYIVAAQLSPEFTAALVDTWKMLNDRLAEQSHKPAFVLPQTYSEALLALADEVEQREKLEAQALIAAPKVDYVDNVLGQAKGKTLLSDFGKALKSDGLPTGGRKIFKQLRALGVLWKHSGKPHERYVNTGYLEYNIKQTSFGEACVTFVTDKGKAWVLSKVREAVALGY